jgi:hypothetical protein
VQQSGVRWLFAWTAAAAIAAAGVRSATLSLQDADAPLNWSRAPSDPVSEREFALAPLKPLLTGHREVGYVTVVPNQQLLHPDSEGPMQRYFIAQYVLSPTRLSLRGDLPLVVADFPSDEELERFLERDHPAVRWRSGGTALVQVR